MTPGPADEARRALRAARERASREATGDAGGVSDAGKPRESADSAVDGADSSVVPGPDSSGPLEAGDVGAGDAGRVTAPGPARGEPQEAGESATPSDAARAALREARRAARASGVEGWPEAGAGGAASGSVGPVRSGAPAEGVAARRAASAGGVEGRSEGGAGGAASDAVGLTQSRHGSSADAAGATGRSDEGPASTGSVESSVESSVGSTGGETDPGVDTSTPTADARDTESLRPGPRPADAAREALRAARKRRADAEAAEVEAILTRRPRKTGPAASQDRSRSRTPGPTAGVRARDVRELLAGAFRMPDDVAPPEEEREDNGGTRQGSSPRETPAPNGSALNSDTLDRFDTAAPTPTAEPPTPTGPSHPTPTAEASAGTGTPYSATPGEAPAAAAAPKRALPPIPASPSPRHPHSMAAPNRDNDLRRTFAAFPPRTSEDARFAATWWGNAWVSALEEGALDAKRLARGRSYAEQGHVDAITVTPGLVLAYVQGSRPRPYRVQVRLRTLGEADWDRFLDLAADKTGHIAALLEKEMPQALAECGVPLLPGPGDLEPQCSCPDRGHPCKHAAALCYQTARLLDADPFVLLLLRGRGERELLDALSRLSAARAARAAQEHEPAPLPGVRASEALAPRRLAPLPEPLPVPAHPEQPPAYPAAPGGPDPFALDQLATDAAARAHTLLGTGRDPVGELTLWQDAVRLAAARPGSGLTAGTRALYASLASATDRAPADLARAVAAWRQGGLEGLAVLEEPWDPPAGRFDRARPLLLAADLPAFRPWRNHLTHPRGHLQLRLGRDGLWYAYESEPGHDDWWPRGTPDLDPVGALTGLGTPTDL